PEIVGVGVQLIAVPRLARTAMAAAIMGDASIAARSEIEHLVFKSIRGERPAVTENDGLSFAPIVVIDLRAVFGRDRAHGLLHWLKIGGRRELPQRLCHTSVRKVRFSVRLLEIYRPYRS